MVKKGRGSNEGESCFPRQQGGWLCARLTPWMPCGPSSPQHGCCIRTRYHTWGEKQKQSGSTHFLHPFLHGFCSSSHAAEPGCFPPTSSKARSIPSILPVREGDYSPFRQEAISLHRDHHILEPLYSAGVCITLHCQPAVMNRTEVSLVCARPNPTEPHHHPPGSAYQETSLTKWSFSAMPAPASKVEEWLSPLKSQETTWNREEIVAHAITRSLNQKCPNRDRSKAATIRKTR